MRLTRKGGVDGAKRAKGVPWRTEGGSHCVFPSGTEHRSKHLMWSRRLLRGGTPCACGYIVVILSHKSGFYIEFEPYYWIGGWALTISLDAWCGHTTHTDLQLTAASPLHGNKRRKRHTLLPPKAAPLQAWRHRLETGLRYATFLVSLAEFRLSPSERFWCVRTRTNTLSC